MPKTVILSRKSYETLLGLCRNRSAQQIAEDAGVAYQTIKSRLRLLYGTLGASTAYGAILRAWHLGVLRTCPVCRHVREDGKDSPSPFQTSSVVQVEFADNEDVIPDLTYEDVITSDAVGSELAPRLLETLRMLAANLSVEEMAEVCGITKHSAGSSVMRTYVALGVHNRVDAVVTGFLKGYVKQEHILLYRQGK